MSRKREALWMEGGFLTLNPGSQSIQSVGKMNPPLTKKTDALQTKLAFSPAVIALNGLSLSERSPGVPLGWLLMVDPGWLNKQLSDHHLTPGLP
jgi:hypothetical protein